MDDENANKIRCFNFVKFYLYIYHKLRFIKYFKVLMFVHRKISMKILNLPRVKKVEFLEKIK